MEKRGSWFESGLQLEAILNDFEGYTFFYKNNFIRTRGSVFAQNVRTIPASAEEQSLKF